MTRKLRMRTPTTIAPPAPVEVSIIPGWLDKTETLELSCGCQARVVRSSMWLIYAVSWECLLCHRQTKAVSGKEILLLGGAFLAVREKMNT